MNINSTSPPKAILFPLTLIALAFIGWFISPPPAGAHQGATGIVKQRMDAMGNMGDHAKAVGDMLKGKQPIDPVAIRAAADAFVSHGQDIPVLFPDTKHSRQGSNTEALPAIWNEWQTFTSLTNRFTEDSRQLSLLAATLGDAITLKDDSARTIRAAFFKTVKSCSSCHDQFRLDKD